MRRHALLVGPFVALLASSPALYAQSLLQPPPAGISGTSAAIYGGLGLIEQILSGGWPVTPRPASGSTPTIYDRNDGSSADTIVTALYESVTNGPDAAPDWERMRGIFLPVGMIVPPRRPQEDPFTVLDVDGFQDRVRKAIATMKEKGEPTAFYEREVARHADCFGNVCHVFSTYESRHDPSDEKPFARGINSIQLVRDGKRWWIASVMWDTERPDNLIPPAYLPATIPPEYLRKN
jgi:hypothetical protein